MENTSATASGAVLDPEIALTLQQNPEAAHFIATLATGTDLRRAVIDHFGSLITPPAAEVSEPQDKSDGPDTSDKPDTSVPADTPMYRPLGDAPDTADESADDDFFTFPAASVWD